MLSMPTATTWCSAAHSDPDRSTPAASRYRTSSFQRVAKPGADEEDVARSRVVCPAPLRQACSSSAVMACIAGQLAPPRAAATSRGRRASRAGARAPRRTGKSGRRLDGSTGTSPKNLSSHAWWQTRRYACRNAPSSSARPSAPERGPCSSGWYESRCRCVARIVARLVTGRSACRRSGVAPGRRRGPIAAAPPIFRSEPPSLPDSFASLAHHE